MTEPVTPKTERSGGLDLLRFLAVVIVFFIHFADSFNYRYQIVPANLKWNVMLRYAPIVVTVFFMISSYVVTMSSIRRDLRTFLIARFSRLYPLFWVSCVVAFLLPRLIHEHTYLMYSHLKLFLVNMTMVPQFFGNEPINPVYWTLTVEVCFYLFIALVILFNLWDHMLTLISIFLVCSITSAFYHTIYLTVFLPFLAGMLFYFIRIGYRRRLILYSLLGITYLCQVQACPLVAASFSQVYNGQVAVSPWVLAGIITGIYMLFYLLAVSPAPVRDSPVTRFFGEITYSFYLFHIYFLYPYWYLRNRVQPDLLIMGMLLAAIFFSWVLRIGVEKPFIALVKKLLYSFNAVDPHGKLIDRMRSGNE